MIACFAVELLSLLGSTAAAFAQNNVLVFGPAELASRRLNDTVTAIAGRTTVGVDVGSSFGVRLGDVSRSNLALLKPITVFPAPLTTLPASQTNPAALVDGDTTSTSFTLSRSQGTATLTIDLLGQQQVRRVDLLSVLASVSPRGYSVSVSTDSVVADARFTEVVATKTALGTSTAIREILPSAVDARLVRVTISGFPPTSNILLREIRIFGEGFIPAGVFVLGPYRLPSPKNLGQVSFTADLPEGTTASVRVLSLAGPRMDSVLVPRTVAGKPVFIYKQIPVYDVRTPVGESLTDPAGGSFYAVPEPVTAFALQVFLRSTNSRATPTLREVRVVADPPVFTGVVASLSPDTVQILRSQPFTLAFDLTAAPGDVGLDSLGLDLPAPITFRSATFNGASVLEAATVMNRSRAFGIRFGSTITTSGRLELTFETQPFEAANPFAARLYSRQTPTNPQQVALGTPATVLVTTGVPQAVFVDLSFKHNPLIGPSPERQLEVNFYLAKLESPRRLLVRVFDLRGRELRTVFDQPTAANAFIGGDAIRWDGRDRDGHLVPPGAYLVRLELDTDEKPTVVTRPVVVAY